MFSNDYDEIDESEATNDYLAELYLEEANLEAYAEREEGERLQATMKALREVRRQIAEALN